MRDDELTRQFYAMPPADRRPEKRKVERAIVPPLLVPPGTARAAQAAAHYAELALPLPGPITIRWMAEPSRLGGQPRVMTPDRHAFVEPIEHPLEIFLLVPHPVDPCKTVLHEARHLWQFPNGLSPEPTVCREDDCGHLIYTLTPEDEDRLELDAFRWERTHRRFV